MTICPFFTIPSIVVLKDSIHTLLLRSLYDQHTELPTNASIASGVQITNYRSYYILKTLIVIITSLV